MLLKQVIQYFVVIALMIVGSYAHSEFYVIPVAVDDDSCSDPDPNPNPDQNTTAGMWRGELFVGTQRRSVEVMIIDTGNSFDASISVSGCYTNLPLELVTAGEDQLATTIGWSIENENVNDSIITQYIFALDQLSVDIRFSRVELIGVSADCSSRTTLVSDRLNRV